MRCAHCDSSPLTVHFAKNMDTKIKVVGLTADVDEDTLTDLLENKKRMQCNISAGDVIFNRDRGAALVTLDHTESKQVRMVNLSIQLPIGVKLISKIPYFDVLDYIKILYLKCYNISLLKRLGTY